MPYRPAFRTTRLYPGATERADFWAWAAEWDFDDRVWLELSLWLTSTP
jgi:hypothetical protein